MRKKLRSQLLLFFLIVQLGSMFAANGFNVVVSERYVGQEIREGLYEHRILAHEMAKKTELSISEIAAIVSSASYEMSVIQQSEMPAFTQEEQKLLRGGGVISTDTHGQEKNFFYLRDELVVLAPVLFDSLSRNMLSGGFYNNLFFTLITFLGVVLFSKRLTKPITALTQAMRKVASGDFDIHIDLNRSRGLFKPSQEVMELTEHFNQMSHELKSIEYLRRDFTSSVSHEIKTPVASITGYASMLKNPDLSQEERQEFAAAIETEARSMAVLSDNLLKLTRLESQQFAPPKQEFALDEQLRQIISAMYTEIERKGITLDVHLQEITMMGDEDLLRQVWQNLLVNAIKFTDRGGEIRIFTETAREQVTVHIEDTGIGMEQAVTERIFEKFYQADASHHAGGHGLGLALVLRIVDISGGQIRVKSSIGKGSRFSVMLPR